MLADAVGEHLSEYGRALSGPFDLGKVLGRPDATGRDGESSETPPVIDVVDVSEPLYSDSLGEGPDARTLSIHAVKLTNDSERIVTMIHPPGDAEGVFASVPGFFEIPSMTDRSSAHNRLLAIPERHPDLLVLAFDTKHVSTYSPALPPLEGFLAGFEKTETSAEEMLAILHFVAGDKEVTLEALSGGGPTALEMLDINSRAPAEAKVNIRERAYLTEPKLIIKDAPPSAPPELQRNPHVTRLTTIGGYILHVAANGAETAVKSPGDIVNSSGIVNAVYEQHSLIPVLFGNFLGHLRGTDYGLVSRVLTPHIISVAAPQNCSLREEDQLRAMGTTHNGRLEYKLIPGGHLSVAMNRDSVMDAHFPRDETPQQAETSTPVEVAQNLAAGALTLPLEAVREVRRGVPRVVKLLPGVLGFVKKAA